MKTLYYIIATLIAVNFSLTSCTKSDPIEENDNCDNITINIKNLSGIDIHDFSLEDKTWDNLQDGTTIQNICLDNLTLDSDYPLLYFTGIMEGEDIKSSAYLHWCGTGMHSVNEGVFNIHITERSGFNMEFVNYEYYVD